MNDLFSNVLASVILAVASVLAAIIAQLFSRYRKRELKTHRENVEEIARVIQTEESARKAAVVERVIERIPVGLSKEQFSTLLEEITNRIPAPPQVSTPTISAVEDLINNYHEQALNQAKAQFWFSVVAATVGFVWILITGSGIAPDNLATTSRILPGVVVDAVAFLFFRQAAETRQRATELYDRLRRDKQMTESTSLVSSIDDIRLKSAVKAQIALHMSGLQPGPIDLSTFLSLECKPIQNESPKT